jgi:outer membrane protein TolC
MIAPQTTADDLITTALQTRPDLAANREAIEAAWLRVRRQAYGPLMPKVALANQTGSFGAGINSNIGDFRDRNALTAQLFWELKSFGLGNIAEANERRAQAEQAQYQMIDAQARVTAEIIELAQLVASRYEALDLLQNAVKEAEELYRISKEGTLNAVDAKNLFDALRPLQAIQVLNQAKQNYLTALLDYNRAQFRLYVSLGRPPLPPETTPSVVKP